MQATTGSIGKLDEALPAVPFTCRITAAHRAVELVKGTPPIIEDPLAQHLAGPKALEMAEHDYVKLVEAQGPGLHLRIPARNRLLDDKLLAVLQAMRAAGTQGPLQVVNVGAGMDTRPWRLSFPPSVCYVDIDQPGVMELKRSLLTKAGAQTTPSACSTDNGSSDEGSNPDSVSNQNFAYAITAASWHGVAADLSQVSLREALTSKQGFLEGAPTVWVAEALLYYLTLPQASELLRAMAALSGAGSMLLATCIDKALLDASLHNMKGHPFSELWHFSMDDLWTPGSGSSVLSQCGWDVVDAPRTTAELALTQYGMKTYVPFYSTHGGAECMFAAHLQQQWS